MPKEFINPNWHVILIHYPLGVFVLGMLIELFSFLYRAGTLRLAGRWMILLGALLGIPTALSGIYALGNVVRMNLPADAPANHAWKDLTGATHLNTEQWEFLSRHAWAQSLSTALAVVLVTVALGASDRWRRRLYFPVLLGLVLSLAGMVWGAYFGGEMVYRHGTAVLAIEPKAVSPPATQPNTAETAAGEQVEKKVDVEYFVPPLQAHVFMAGLAVAVALGALGLSMRAIAVAGDGGGEYGGAGDERFGAEREMLYQPPVPRGPAAMDVARSLNPDADVTGRPRRLPVSRLWLLAALFAVCASAAGLWMLAGHRNRTFDPKALWAKIVPDKDHPLNRRSAHVATGVVIIAVPLLLAAVTRMSRRPKVSVTLLGLLLLTAVAVQVWLGTLLMLDTPRGPLHQFNPPGTAGTAPTMEPATAPATQGVAAGV